MSSTCSLYNMRQVIAELLPTFSKKNNMYSIQNQNLDSETKYNKVTQIEAGEEIFKQDHCQKWSCTLQWH